LKFAIRFLLFILLLFVQFATGQSASLNPAGNHTDAICDDVHDDTAAIQDAINATYAMNYFASAKGNPDVELPQGICRITKTLIMGPYGSLHGQGHATTIHADYASWTGGSNHDAIDIVFSGSLAKNSATVNQGVYDLAIAGSGNSTISSSTAIHIYNSASSGNFGDPSYACNGCDVRGVLISGFDTGIETEDWAYSHILYTTISQVRRGIWVNGASVADQISDTSINLPSTSFTSQRGTVGLHITNNPKYTGCGVPGPNLCGPQGITFSGNTIIGYGYDVDLEAGESFFITEDTFDYGGIATIFLNNTDRTAYAGQIHDLKIAHNWIGTNAGPVGVAVLDTAYLYDGAWIEDNYILNYATPGSTDYGVEINDTLGAAPGIHILDNHFQNFGTGVFVNAPIEWSVIRGNTGNGQTRALINVNDKTVGWALIDGNEESAPVPAVANYSKSVASMGLNSSPTQIGGIRTAGGAGCTITPGAVGNSCTATITNSVSMLTTNYQVIGCSVVGASGMVSVSQLAAAISSPTSFSVAETALSATATGGGKINCSVYGN
jgi:hypothetical protein